MVLCYKYNVHAPECLDAELECSNRMVKNAVILFVVTYIDSNLTFRFKLTRDV